MGQPSKEENHEKVLFFEKLKFEGNIDLTAPNTSLKAKNTQMMSNKPLANAKLPMKHDSRLLQYVLLLRYGPSAMSEAPKPILNFRSIARIISKPATTVRELVKAGRLAAKYGLPHEAPSRSKFKQHHISYLISPETLQACAHMSLEERALVFHR